MLSCVQPFATLSMEFSRQVYWSSLPSLPPGHLSWPRNQAMALVSPALQVNSLPAELLGKSPGLQ